MPRYDCEWLVQGTLQGDSRAVEGLYQFCCQYRHYIQLRHPQDYEDLLHDLCLRIHTKVLQGHLKEPLALPGFIQTATRFILWEHSQSQRGNQYSSAPTERAREPSPEDQCIHKETLRRLRRAMRRMSNPRYQLALQVMCLEECSWDEAQRTLGMTPRQIQNAKHRGILALRKELTRGG